MAEADDILWEVRHDPKPGGTRLILMPHAGGSAHYYAPWTDRLPKDAGLRIAQYPGRGNRFAEGPPASMAELVDPIVEVLLNDPADTVLFGHSMGSLVAFEVARRLTAAGHRPSALVVSACRAPREPNPSPVKPADLTDDSLVEALRRRGGTDPAILAARELWPVILPAVRADFTIDDMYRYTGPFPALDCPILVLAGDSDPVVPPDALRGWNDETGAQVRVRSLPGGHFHFDESDVAMDLLMSELRASVSAPSQTADPRVSESSTPKG